MFVNWYFDNFCDSDPFGHGGEDYNSMYKGFRRDLDARLGDLHKAGLTHNALEDAIKQAKDVAEMFRLMKLQEDDTETGIPF